jgi:large subunit ribosomal protein L30
MSVRVTQIKSKIGTQPRHRGTLRALGLGRIGQTAVHQESPQLQGMLRRVAWLVRVEEEEVTDGRA